MGVKEGVNLGSRIKDSLLPDPVSGGTLASFVQCCVIA